MTVVREPEAKRQSRPSAESPQPVMGPMAWFASNLNVCPKCAHHFRLIANVFRIIACEPFVADLFFLCARLPIRP